ncbi:MAG: TIGR04283 family arsenosugar biosynthesis glycosyltransferase [Gammaproteobacteria bacterium]|nr:TIGR04283 family arsenosugar biosynthesis glycosyltransferase [Gammaproteobacteria bacterium]
MKRISIIIPVLNEAAALRAHLPLLQPFRSAGHEVILVDGGSVDGSADLASGLVDVVVTSEPGRARQMNAGAEMANGEILLFLHIDTLLPEDALAQIQSALGKLSAMWGHFDVRLSGDKAVFRLIGFMMNLRSRVSGVATGDQGIFVRTAVFRRVGGFADIPLMEDVALSKTLRRIASPVCLRVRVITSSRRWEKHGVLRTVFLMWWLRLLYFVDVAPQSLHAMYVKKK